MPRAPRILIGGGLYPVHNRFARGEEVFSDPEEAVAFLDLLRELKQRDDLQVFAWCLLSNHFRIASNIGGPVVSQHAIAAAGLRQGVQQPVAEVRAIVAEQVSDAVGG